MRCRSACSRVYLAYRHLYDTSYIEKFKAIFPTDFSVPSLSIRVFVFDLLQFEDLKVHLAWR